jgi:hypothetical protein
MPTYEPDAWNASDAVNVNNCYNYATNNRNKAESGSGGRPTAKVKPATPGATKDIDPFRVRNEYTVDRRTGRVIDVRMRLTITCKGLEAACKADGIHEASHCNDQNPNCWRIALFIRNYRPGFPGADFHFAREDRPGHWSHKTGHRDSKATNKQFNRTSGKYDGPELTDPSTQNVGPYKFCGYMCVCPDTRVAYNAPPAEEESGAANAMVTMDEYADLSGMSPPVALLEAADFDRFAAAALPAADTAEWIEGFGPGQARFRFDRADPAGDGGVQAIFISDESVTVWDGELRHAILENGVIPEAVRALGASAVPAAGDDQESLRTELRALAKWVKPALVALLVSVWVGIALILAFG